MMSPSVVFFLRPMVVVYQDGFFSVTLTFMGHLATLPELL